MDAVAKHHLHTSHFSTEDILRFSPHPSSFPIIHINNKRVYDRCNTTLYLEIAENCLKEAWFDKGRISRSQDSHISWDAQNKAMSSSDLTRQRSIRKWSSNNLATGKNMTRWKLCFHGHCPYCLAPN